MKEMIKKYKGTLICSVLVMLAGILVGFTMAQSIWINVFFVVTDCILVCTGDKVRSEPLQRQPR